MIKKIGAFLGRISSDKQRDESIDDQLRVCQEWADRNNIIIPEKFQFSDLHISGTISDRPGLQGMLLALEEYPEIEFVIIDELSRLSRSDLQALITTYKLSENNKTLIAVSDGIDSRDPTSKWMIHLKAIMNNVRLDELRNETKRGQIGQKLKGRSCGENVFGYKSVPDGEIIFKKGVQRPEGYKHVIYEEESKIVLMIFQMYDKGASPCDIAKSLSQQGKKTRRGGSWNTSTISNILRNERYIGIWVWNATKVSRSPLNGKIKKVPRPEQEWFVETRENLRIVPQNLWDSVQQKLQAATKPFPQKKSLSTNQPKGNNVSYIHSYPRELFDGMYRCGVCGNAIVKVSGKAGGYLGCHHAVLGVCTNKVIMKKRLVDDIIIGYLTKEVLKPDVVDRTLKDVELIVRDYRGDAPEKLRAVSKELDQLKAKIANYVRFIGEGNDSLTIGKSLMEAEKEENDLEKQKNVLEKANSKIFKAPPIEWIQQRLKSLTELLRKNPSQSTLIVKKLLGKLIFQPVYPDIGKPYYQISSTLQALTLIDEDSDDSSNSSNSIRWWTPIKTFKSMSCSIFRNSFYFERKRGDDKGSNPLGDTNLFMEMPHYL